MTRNRHQITRGLPDTPYENEFDPWEGVEDVDITLFEADAPAEVPGVVDYTPATVPNPDQDALEDAMAKWKAGWL